MKVLATDTLDSPSTILVEKTSSDKLAACAVLYHALLRTREEAFRDLAKGRLK